MDTKSANLTLVDPKVAATLLTLKPACLKPPERATGAPRARIWNNRFASQFRFETPLPHFIDRERRAPGFFMTFSWAFFFHAKAPSPALSSISPFAGPQQTQGPRGGWDQLARQGSRG